MDSLVLPKIPLTGRFEVFRAPSFVAGGGRIGFLKLSSSPKSINALLLAPRSSGGFACLSVSGGGGGGGDGRELGGSGGGGGGDGGSGGKDSGDIIAAAVEPEHAADSQLADTIVLIVQGMVCGGCAATVKRILESQPQVASAVVSFDAGTAVVCVHPEVRELESWQQELGEKLANHLTTCGFKTNLKGKVTEGKVAES